MTEKNPFGDVLTENILITEYFVRMAYEEMETPEIAAEIADIYYDEDGERIIEGMRRLLDRKTDFPTEAINDDAVYCEYDEGKTRAWLADFLSHFEKALEDVRKRRREEG